jgi:cyanate lyase
MDQEITEKLLHAKKQKGLTFADLEKELGRDEVWIAALFYRQASASREEAEKLASALGLGPDLADILTGCPAKRAGPGCAHRSPRVPLLRNHAGLRDAPEGRHP